MTEHLNIVVEYEANETRREFILNNLRRFNDSQSMWHQSIRKEGAKPLDVFALDDKGNVLGGLIGETYWGWLAIDYLWLVDVHRGNGLGSLLVLEAETVALENRECQWSKVSTFSFQAPNFYQNLGYEIIGQLDDYPPGETMYWLKKTLPKPTND
jgi:GNAT superfamily N-acetyltransferase